MDMVSSLSKRQQPTGMNHKEILIPLVRLQLSPQQFHFQGIIRYKPKPPS